MLENAGTNLGYGEYTYIKWIYEERGKREINKFIEQELSVNASFLTELQRKNYIKIVDGLVYLRDSAKALFLKQKTNPKTRAINLAAKLIEIFPKGKKNGSYYWRSSVSVITAKLTSFFKKYTEYSNEEIISATKNYVNSFNMITMDAAMMLLKYFIEKNNVSTLLEYLENTDEVEDNQIRKNKTL